MSNAKGFVVVMLAALLASVAQSQTPQPTPKPLCPTVTVDGPANSPPGLPITFNAKVTGGDPNVTPTFDWTASAGTITGWKGAASVTVDMTGVATDSLTATVTVGGYDRSCSTSASCSILWCRVVARKLDEYGRLSIGDEKARLVYFAKELENDPSARGYLVCYGGRRGRRDEAQRRCERALNHLGTQFRDIDAMRFVTVDGGFREEPTVELWLVSSGASPPPATPTVDPSEVSPPTTQRRARPRGRR